MLNATTVLYKSYRSGMFANHYLFIPIDSYGKWDKSRGKPGRHKEEVLCNTAKSLLTLQAPRSTYKFLRLISIHFF